LALFSTLAALLPHYERTLAMSTFSSGILADSYTAGTIVGILVAGLWTSGRFGARATALAGCGLLAAASLGFGSPTASSPWTSRADEPLHRARRGARMSPIAVAMILNLTITPPIPSAHHCSRHSRSRLARQCLPGAHDHQRWRKTTRVRASNS
jgi:MFS family permease